jgi:hypothetical protein
MQGWDIILTGLTGGDPFDGDIQFPLVANGNIFDRINKMNRISKRKTRNWREKFSAAR